jgi:hypothetical protein
MTIDEGTRELLRLAGEGMTTTGQALLAIANGAGGFDEYLDTKAYAKRMGVSVSTVKRQLLANQIPGARKVGGVWTIRVEEVAS